MTISLKEISQAATGILTGFTALLVAFNASGEAVTSILKSIGLPGAEWLPWVLAAISLLVGVSLLWRGLSRKSRLLWPEALLIDPDNPDHLRGRTDEVRRLSQAVSTRPLVFLEGESGSGKSALIRSGLIPALRNPSDGSLNSSILPI